MSGPCRLDLGKKPQRDICLRLLELQNSQLKLIKEMEEYYAVRAGGARGDVDRTWRNGKIDGVEHSHVSNAFRSRALALRLTREKKTPCF